MTIGAAWNEISCSVPSVMDLALREILALQKFVADRTHHLPAAFDAILGVLRKRPCVLLYMASVARMTSDAAWKEIL